MTQFVPIETPPMRDDRMVSVPLSEIQRIRDRIRVLHHMHPDFDQLFRQIAGLYQRLEQQPPATESPR